MGVAASLEPTGNAVVSVANLLGVLVLALGVGLGVAAAGPRLAAINTSAVDIQRTEGARRPTRRPFDRSRIEALGPVLGTSQRLQRVARLQFLSVGSVGLLLVLSLMRAPSTVNLLAGAVVCAGAWQVPLILARRQSQALAQAVDRELGDALGELVMGVEAGLTLEAVMTRCSSVRRFGAAALDLAYVAAGRYDGYWERGLSAWDIAAGMLLVKEAGGYCTDYKNRDKCIETGEVVAANDYVHGKLLKTLRDATKA